MPKSLNELDKKTLHSYRDKARLVSKVNKRNAQTMDNVAKQKAQAGDMKGMSQALDSAKKKREVAYKRDAGSDKALQKLKTKAKETLNERGLSASEKRDREDIVKGMKKNKTEFMKRYGRDHESVMYATATKLAKQDEETLHELDKDTLKSYVGKAQANRLDNIDKFQKKLREAEFDADKPKRGIQRKRVNLQFGRQQRYNPTPFKKDQQQDLYKKSDPIEKKIRKSRENKRFPDYRQDKDTGVIKKDFLPGGAHAKKYGGLQNKKTKPNVTATTEDRVIHQLKILIAENKYDLYSSGEHKTASRFAEKEIDRHLAKAKKMKDYHTARTHMDKVLAKHAKHGSDDSEPHQIVTSHLNNHFGTKHGRNDHLDFMKGRPEYSGPRVKPVKENFQDGRNPEDKGDAKRHGLSGKQSSSSLKKVRSSDSASPRKKQLAHWILNMRKGRNKKK